MGSGRRCLTNTVESVRLEHGSDILRIALARSSILCSLREARGIAPASNGNHKLGIRAESLAHAVGRLERLE